MTPESAEARRRYRWVIMGVCWLAYIVAFMQRLSIGPLAPFLKADLGINSEQLGMLMSAAVFGYMITLVPSGWLADKIGPRWMLLIGEMIGGVFMAAMFTVRTFHLGLVFIALAGLGMGCIMPSVTKAMVVWFPARERATAMGVNQTAVNIGGIVTAATLPAVALALSWNFGFLGIGIIGMAIGIISFLFYRDPPVVASQDNSETVALPVSMPSALEVFKSRDIWLISFSGMFMMAIEFSALAHFVLYLQEKLLMAVVAAGGFLALLQAGGAFGKPASGFVSDRMFRGRRKGVYLLLVVLTGVSCFLLSFLVADSPVWALGILALILGLSGISWGGIHITFVGEMAGKERAGMVVGMSTVLMLIGNMFGPPVFGQIIDTTGSYTLGWQFLAGLAAAAVVPLIFVREKKRRI